MATLVYIVHMLLALAARLFRQAALAGLMSKGYVWIATAGSLPNHGDTDSMQGVVSLVPRVQVTDQLRDFSRLFKVRFRQENPNLENDDPNLPVSLIWLHDTAWAAAAAAEVSFRTAPSTTLLDALLVNKLDDDLTGRFRLMDGHRECHQPRRQDGRFLDAGVGDLDELVPQECRGKAEAGPLARRDGSRPNRVERVVSRTTAACRHPTQERFQGIPADSLRSPQCVSASSGSHERTGLSCSVPLCASKRIMLIRSTH